MLAAIVLAAGASRRFGSQKLLADLRGKPVVRWAVENVLAALRDEVVVAVVVVGHQGDEVRAALDGLPVRVVMNREWAEGIGSSVRAGIAAVGADSRAAMIALGDQPRVDPDVITRLLDACSDGSRPIVVPSYRGERGHPVIFASSIFPELLELRGDRGARDVIARDPGRVTRVHLDAPSPVDVDTKDALDSIAAL